MTETTESRESGWNGKNQFADHLFDTFQLFSMGLFTMIVYEQNNMNNNKLAVQDKHTTYFNKDCDFFPK